MSQLGQDTSQVLTSSPAAPPGRRRASVSPDHRSAKTVADWTPPPAAPTPIVTPPPAAPVEPAEVLLWIGNLPAAMPPAASAEALAFLGQHGGAFFRDGIRAARARLCDRVRTAAAALPTIPAPDWQRTRDDLDHAAGWVTWCGWMLNNLGDDGPHVLEVPRLCRYLRQDADDIRVVIGRLLDDLAAERRGLETTIGQIRRALEAGGRDLIEAVHAPGQPGDELKRLIDQWANDVGLTRVGVRAPVAPAVAGRGGLAFAAGPWLQAGPAVWMPRHLTALLARRSAIDAEMAQLEADRQRCTDLMIAAVRRAVELAGGQERLAVMVQTAIMADANRSTIDQREQELRDAETELRRLEDAGLGDSPAGDMARQRRDDARSARDAAAGAHHGSMRAMAVDLIERAQAGDESGRAALDDLAARHGDKFRPAGFPAAIRAARTDRLALAELAAVMEGAA